MARIDAVLEKVFQEAAQELVLETGTTALIRSGDRERSVFREPLSSQQILMMLAEVGPEGLADELAAKGTMGFSYASPAGTVQVRIERSGASVRAVMAPGESQVKALSSTERAANAAIEKALAEAAAAGGQGPAASLAASAAGGAGAAGAANVAVAGGASLPRRSAGPNQAASLPADPRAAMEHLLALMLHWKASDLHLSSEAPVMLRIDGEMVPVPQYGMLDPVLLKEYLWSIAPQRNKDEWEKLRDTDFAHENDQARFRVNVFEDRKGIGAVMRQIPAKIMTAEEMGLSQAILDLCNLTKGLVLVTGPTGSGKSTTLAAMIDYINRNRSDHILTIEDPVEFVHPNKRCLVNQREVGVHTSSFKHALRAALREDPDIVLVGELRDLETIAIAIETAETGHLVFGTLHTNTAPSTVDRIIDQFPPDRQEQIRMMLSDSLKGVIAQTLCKRIGGGRAAALEVLIATTGVSNLIREGKTFQIPSLMQTGRGHGMVMLNDALLDLVKRGVVEPTEAYKKAVARAEFKTLLERNGISLTVDEASA